MSGPSLRGAINGKCRSCGAEQGAGRLWRDHIAVCPVYDCALWPVRPLPRNTPDFIAARKLDALPPNWRRLSHESALAMVRHIGPDPALPDGPTASGNASVAAGGE